MKCENCNRNKGIANAQFCERCETIMYLYVTGTLTQAEMASDMLNEKRMVYEAKKN